MFVSSGFFLPLTVALSQFLNFPASVSVCETPVLRQGHVAKVHVGAKSARRYAQRTRASVSTSCWLSVVAVGMRMSSAWLCGLVKEHRGKCTSVAEVGGGGHLCTRNAGLQGSQPQHCWFPSERRGRGWQGKGARILFLPSDFEMSHADVEGKDPLSRSNGYRARASRHVGAQRVLAFFKCHLVTF